MLRHILRRMIEVGTVHVGAGLVVSGLSAYAFLVITGRVLGPERYAALSVLWSLVITIGPGIFAPFEQELARAIAFTQGRNGRTFAGTGKAWAIGGGVVMLFCGVATVSGGWILHALLEGDVLLLWALIASIPAYYAQHLGRGVVLGKNMFGRYGGVLAMDGALRVLGAVVLSSVGVSEAGPYGLVLAGAPALSALIAVHPRVETSRGGVEAMGWSGLARALAWLVLASVLAQILANAGPVALKLLADVDETAIVGPFMAALVIVRVPVFLFFAVQAVLLPQLSSAAGGDDSGRYRSALSVVLRVVVTLGGAMTIGAYFAGPFAVDLLFGPDFVLPGAHLARLAIASAGYMMCLVLAQALIAIQTRPGVTAGWAIGLLALVSAIALGGDLLVRVETSLIAGSVGGILAMGTILVRQLRRPDWSQSGKGMSRIA